LAATIRCSNVKTVRVRASMVAATQCVFLEPKGFETRKGF